MIQTTQHHRCDVRSCPRISDTFRIQQKTKHSLSLLVTGCVFLVCRIIYLFETGKTNDNIIKIANAKIDITLIITCNNLRFLLDI
ncbi:hypothetical protein DN0046_00280 [Finegoldia magna]